MSAIVTQVGVFPHVSCCINSLALTCAGRNDMRTIDFTTAVTARERAARFASARRAFKAIFQRWAADRKLRG
jgi:hypothetical protein